MQARQEMTIKQFVETLPDIHRARREYEAQTKAIDILYDALNQIQAEDDLYGMDAHGLARAALKAADEVLNETHA